MHRLIQRLQASRIGRLCRRRPSQSGEHPHPGIYAEMEQGAVIGFFASTLIALGMTGGNVSAVLLAFLSSLGFFTGGVIGAIIWIGSAELPVEPVRAPGPGQARKRQRHRRPDGRPR